MNNKDRILYFLTVFSFASINFLNVTYSFIKRFIQEEFGMNSTEIGVADALKFLGNIVGLLIYINSRISQKSHTTLFYSISMALNGIFMGIIPGASLINYQQKWVVFTFNFFGGMFKAPSWPLLLQLVKEKIFQKGLNKKNQDSKNDFIVWTSLTLLGNIFGLIVSENLIYNLHLQWHFALLIPIGCIFLSSLLLSLYYYFVYPKDSKPNIIQTQFISQSEQPRKSQNLALKCLKLLFLTKDCTFVWSLVLLLSLHSIMMMFLPLFLFKIGYHEYEGYILAWYNLWVIFGAYLFTYVNNFINYGSIFGQSPIILPKNEPQVTLEQQKEIHDIQDFSYLETSQFSNISEKINCLSLFFLFAVCIVLVVMPCPYSCSSSNIETQINPEDLNHNYKVIWHFTLFGLAGLFLGGPLNNYQSNQLIQVMKNYEQGLKNQKIDINLKNKSGQAGFKETGTIDQAPKVFIGIVQLVSYFTVMFFLALTGHIIETNLLGFFYLISILSTFLLIIDSIKIAEINLRN